MPVDPLNRSKVIMRSVTLAPDGTLFEQTATDWVGDDILQAYIDDARGRWQSVVVDEVAVVPLAVVNAPYTIPDTLNTDLES